MGYEPTLIISKKDLDKHKRLLEDGKWQWDRSSEESKKIMFFLKGVYEQGPIIVNKVELLVCTPELTSFNARVRDKLCKLKVEYGEYW